MNRKPLIFAAALSIATVPAAGVAVAADSGSQQPNVVQKAGNYISDSALTAKIKADLLAEPKLKSLDIHVETTDGVVTLSGTVPSSAEIQQAVDVTEHVKGVKDVHNALRVQSG